MSTLLTPDEDFERAKFVFNLAHQYGPHLLVGSFAEEGYGVKGVDEGINFLASYEHTLLEYMKMWCNILAVAIICQL